MATNPLQTSVNNRYDYSLPVSMYVKIELFLQFNQHTTTLFCVALDYWNVMRLFASVQPFSIQLMICQRLLECGGAKVEELRRMTDGDRKGSNLTHIFHDGSMCFADILTPYRQKGIPCLRPVYISDCLLVVRTTLDYISLAQSALLRSVVFAERMFDAPCVTIQKTLQNILQITCFNIHVCQTSTCCNL